jgi:hypothetical protein
MNKPKTKIDATIKIDPRRLGEPEADAWLDMFGRCYDKTHPRYPEEGAKGIRVCPQWWEYAQFYEDMGPMRLERN